MPTHRKGCCIAQGQPPEFESAAIKNQLSWPLPAFMNTFRPLKYAHLWSGHGSLTPNQGCRPELDRSTQKRTPLQLNAFTKSLNRTCEHNPIQGISITQPYQLRIESKQCMTVTNVSSPVSTYHAKVTPTQSIDVAVGPHNLHFSHQRRKVLQGFLQNKSSQQHQFQSPDTEWWYCFSSESSCSHVANAAINHFSSPG